MDISDIELTDRYQSLLRQYADMAPTLALSLEKFGRLRGELQILVVEMEKRKLKEPDASQNPEP